MGGQESQEVKKQICAGLLAHVDAGKTTLAESILYRTGNLKKLGRVDHKDAFLDTFALERARGITIFSKQARLTLGDSRVTLLDTPGHTDFCAEMERTLQVLDYAVLVISGADGVQGHVQTLWRLLKHYRIPVFIFVNKMDQPGTEEARLLAELQKRLSEGCIAFSHYRGDVPKTPLTQDRLLQGEITARERLSQEKPSAEGSPLWGGMSAEEHSRWQEALAMCSEELMEEYLEQGEIGRETIALAIAKREVFPCFFGSALKLQGVDELLRGMEEYCLEPQYPEEFGARVFKIARDASGSRLTYLKVTGASLKVKMLLGNERSAPRGGSQWQEKADQLRIYHGAGYSTVEEVAAGGICAVAGLTKTFAGQGLGYEQENELPVLEPVLTYQVLLPEGSDPIRVLGQLKQLEEEEPQLHIVWKEEVGEIHAQVMGEVQIEVLRSLIAQRYGLEVAFGSGSIVYKETIAEAVVGIGHFEPLRHYAEVHLLLEPGERGSGLQFASLCSEELLDRSWQRLVLTHLEERTHPGVLTGAEITDMRILLIAGRAHVKHTEGGDFRQATYRAVRQGLRRGKNVLLEPVFAFTLEVPTENLGRAMSDIQRMYGSFDPPVTDGEVSTLTGSVPVESFGDYQKEIHSYTRGHGRLSLSLKGYEPCHNAEEVIEAMHYEPEADTANPTGSVFCAHGAGFVVEWDRVEEYAHVENGWSPKEEQGREEPLHHAGKPSAAGRENARKSSAAWGYITQEEIEAIFRQTYGKKAEDTNRFRRYHKNTVYPAQGADASGQKSIRERHGEELPAALRGAGNRMPGHASAGAADRHKEYLLVDGYNIIFAWEELRELAAVNIDSARDKLMDVLSNYQGYTGGTLILVFDAYKVKGNPGSVQRYHNIHVVYTREAETADQYIEKTVHDIGRRYRVTVATSDALEQMIIWGSGASRLSARGLKEAVERSNREMKERFGIGSSAISSKK